jgi:hypothetical protein
MSPERGRRSKFMPYPSVLFLTRMNTVSIDPTSPGQIGLGQVFEDLVGKLNGESSRPGNSHGRFKHDGLLEWGLVPVGD